MKKTIILVALMGVITFSYAETEPSAQKVDEKKEIKKERRPKGEKSIAGLVWRAGLAILITFIVIEQSSRK